MLTAALPIALRWREQTYYGEIIFTGLQYFAIVISLLSVLSATRTDSSTLVPQLTLLLFPYVSD